MLSVEAEPRIHHTSELLPSRLDVHITASFHFLYPNAMAPRALHLREELPSWSYLTVERVNSSLTERGHVPFISESTQASPLLIHLCLWQSAHLLPPFPHQVQIPVNQTASVFRVYWVHLQQTSLSLALFLPLKRQQSLLKILHFFTKLDSLCDSYVQRQFLLITTILFTCIYRAD